MNLLVPGQSSPDDTSPPPSRALTRARHRAYLRYFREDAIGRRLLLAHVTIALGMVGLVGCLQLLLFWGRDHLPFLVAATQTLEFTATMALPCLVLVVGCLWVYPPGLGSYTAEVRKTDAFQVLVAEEEAAVRAREQAARLTMELPGATRGEEPRKRL